MPPVKVRLVQMSVAAFTISKSQRRYNQKREKSQPGWRRLLWSKRPKIISSTAGSLATPLN